MNPTSPPTSSSAPAGATDMVGEPLEGELARLFEHAHDLLVVLDFRGRVVLASPSVEQLLGYPVEELLGKPLRRWVHPDDRAAVKARVRALVEQRSTAELDTRLRRCDGSWVPTRWSLSVGGQRRMYGVGRDRTGEAQDRELFLQQQAAQLQLRTALELHDGILQVLTGAGFQIAVARRLMHRDPDAAEEVLAALAKSVSAEQQEMRLYVDEVKGEHSIWADGDLGLGNRIRGMLERVALIWTLEVTADVRIPKDLPAERERQILRIVQEAAVNAARHGGAGTVSVEVVEEEGEILVEVRDDGHGFSFLGEYDGVALREQRLGPLSLKRRVEEVGGTIFIRSTRSGAFVSVRIPAVAPAGT